MSNRFLYTLKRLAKHELKSEPIDQDLLEDVIKDTIEQINSGVSAAFLKEITLELAIELVEELIAERLDNFWRFRDAPHFCSLPSSSKEELTGLLVDFLSCKSGSRTMYDKGARWGSRSTDTPDVTSSEKAVLSLYGVCYEIYSNPTNRVDILKDVNLNIPPRRLVAVCGPNGAGKTTLLSIMAGIRAPSRGIVAMPLIDSDPQHSGASGWQRVKGFSSKNWTTRKSNIFFLSAKPQGPKLGLEATLHCYAGAAGHGPNVRRLSVSLATKRYSLQSLLSKRWSELSQGERHKFSLACGSILRPKLFLLDEPLSPLDEKSRIQFMMDLRGLTRRRIRKTTAIFSTHNASDAERFSDSILILAQGMVSDIATHTKAFSGQLFRFGFQSTHAGVSPPSLKDCLSILVGGWLLVKAPDYRPAREVILEIIEAGDPFLVFEDLTNSALRGQIESLFEEMSANAKPY